MEMDLSTIELHFSKGGLLVMNISLALIMFAVALGMDFNDLKNIKTNSRGVWSGLFSQWILLPLITIALIYLIKPHPLFALGMIMVAVCPGGNVSNFFTMIAKGNVGLSVVLTSFSSLFAAFLTPLGFVFWSNLSGLSSEAKAFSLSFLDLAGTLLLILVFPLVFGAMLRKFQPKLARLLTFPSKILGGFILFAFIGVALWNNREAFVDHLDKVFLLVLIHNALVLLSSYLWSGVSGNSFRSRITITIETGIQNSGLALIIIFTFFDGNGGMAMVAAWWGVWHLVAGSLTSFLFSRRSARNPVTE